MSSATNALTAVSQNYIFIWEVSCKKEDEYVYKFFMCKNWYLEIHTALD